MRAVRLTLCLKDGLCILTSAPIGSTVTEQHPTHPTHAARSDASTRRGVETADTFRIDVMDVSTTLFKEKLSFLA